LIAIHMAVAFDHGARQLLLRHRAEDLFAAVWRAPSHHAALVAVAEPPGAGSSTRHSTQPLALPDPICSTRKHKLHDRLRMIGDNYSWSLLRGHPATSAGGPLFLFGTEE
jgi:hypothetical protein